MKIRIYPDIDGVFNPFMPPSPFQKHTPNKGDSDWEGEWYSGGVPLHYFEAVPPNVGDTFHLCWSEELIRGFNELSKRDDVEIVWATTWRKNAKIFAEAVGLEEGSNWRFIDATWERIVDETKEWWKLEAVKQDLLENPVDGFIWIDDEFPIRKEALDWIETRNDGFLISPNPEFGISAEMFDKIHNSMVR